jgi:hypothetical protein
MNTKSHDFSLTVDTDGEMLAHKPDCPAVQAARGRDEPIMTMLDCKLPLPLDVRQHECLKHEQH